jgi:hypothetical protein
MCACPLFSPLCILPMLFPTHAQPLCRTNTTHAGTAKHVSQGDAKAVVAADAEAGPDAALDPSGLCAC